MGSWEERMHSKVAAGGAGSPTFAYGRTRRNNWGARQTTQPRAPVWGNKASKLLTEKMCGGCGGRRNSQPQRRVHWRDPQGPRMYTKPPTQESTPEGPSLLVGSRESDWKLAESQASSIVPSPTSSPHSGPQCSNVGCPTLANT